MTAIVGVSMILAAVLVIRAMKIAAPLEPAPWWASDFMCTYVLATAFAGLNGAGIAALFAWLQTGQWRAVSAATAGGVAAAVAVFVVLWGAISAWQKRVRPSAPVIPLGPNQSGSRRPPSEPPLRKAA